MRMNRKPSSYPRSTSSSTLRVKMGCACLIVVFFLAPAKSCGNIDIQFYISYSPPLAGFELADFLFFRHWFLLLLHRAAIGTVQTAALPLPPICQYLLD